MWPGGRVTLSFWVLAGLLAVVVLVIGVVVVVVVVLLCRVTPRASPVGALRMCRDD